jgi:hypothetical protein
MRIAITLALVCILALLVAQCWDVTCCAHPIRAAGATTLMRSALGIFFIVVVLVLMWTMD